MRRIRPQEKILKGLCELALISSNASECEANIQRVTVVAEEDRPKKIAPMTPNMELTRDVHKSTSLGDKWW